MHFSNNCMHTPYIVGGVHDGVQSKASIVCVTFKWNFLRWKSIEREDFPKLSTSILDFEYMKGLKMSKGEVIFWLKNFSTM